MNDIVQFNGSVYEILRSELGDEDALEVLNTFLADTAGKFRTLAANVDNRDEMIREAHSIKSSAATFGFMELSKLARELEAGASNLALAEMLELVRKMTEAFDQTVRFAETNLLKAGSAAV
jgi:HPt (histidine-containing phosphotransfer) domain-containing protein